MRQKLLILLFVLVAEATALFAQSGTCGDNLTWTLEDGVLTISGYGKMNDYEQFRDKPWTSFRKEIKKIVILKGVTSIGDKAFTSCTNLTSVAIPNSVTSIGNYAFGLCESLTSVEISNSITNIGDYAFLGCQSLTSINVSQNNPNYCSADGVLFNENKTTLIKYPANKSGSSYSIPNSVTNIGEAAFSNCRSLTSITIPNSVTSIGQSAFFGCESLTSVEITNSVTSIGKEAFCRCHRLTSINVSQNNSNYCSVDGVLFNKNKTNLIQYPEKSGSSYSIPNSVTSIGNSAFRECRSLVSVTIPNSVTSIGEEAFSNCRSLTSASIPNSVTNIGKMAFYYCSSLSSVTIPNSVTSIGKMAFCSCKSLTSVTIPNSVTSIGNNAFDNCDFKLLKIRTASSANLADAGISSYQIIRITQEEALAAYAKANPNQSVVPKKISEPANLNYVVESLHFTDATGNNAIDANETCHIRFKIRNDGKGEARNCKAKVTLAGSQSGISIQNIAVPTIAPQKSVELDIPVSTNMQTKDGKATFTIEITEPNGFGTDPMELSVATKAFVNPYLSIVGYSVTSSDGSTKLEKKKHFNLQLLLQNTQYGKAENVEVELKIPENVFLVDGDFKTTFASMEGGKAQSIDYEMVVNNNYASNQIPVQVIVKEKYGKYAENRTINLEINQTLSSSKLDIQAVEQNNRPEIQLATIGSDVDKDIPISADTNNNTLVLIVANEHYKSMPMVPYAANDGNVFKEYCIKTLGIPQENIIYQSDATLNDFSQKVGLLNMKVRARAKTGRETHVIFYYTGHGMPDVNAQSAYLMPIDGYDENVSSGYELDKLYQLLGQMQANTVTVFLDACFSGVNRNDQALAVNKGARLIAKSGAPTGNMVVFAASQGNQTASVTDKEKHGLFTYYLLKKLKTTEGDITLSELANYLIGEVNIKSLDLYEKEQIPSVVASPQVENLWQTWKLK